MTSSTAGSRSSGSSGPRPNDALGDPAGELGARGRVEHRRLAVDERADAVGQLAVAGLAQQALAQLGGELVEVVRHPPAS